MSSISISRCVLTRVINCREEGKDGWRRRDGDGERRRPGREGEEERVKKEKENKTKHTLESVVRDRTTQVEERWKERHNGQKRRVEK